MANNGGDQFGGNTYSNSGLDRHSSDSTKRKVEIPKGLKVWSVDVFGDRKAEEPDTISHLFQNSIFTNGLYGEYNNLGNVGSPRINRIFIDRFAGDDFIFIHPYDFFLTNIDNHHFTNTLSPITNLSFNTCGSGNYGEDHFKALFAVNAGKKIGVGMKFDYIYGRGYYQNANTAHFNYSLYGSYLGDRYEAHFLASLNHQKVSENGGITNDEYIKHPESFNDSYQSYEIPTVLSDTWNLNNNQNIFFTHRYNVGFNRKVRMTDEEIEARRFAIASKQQQLQAQKEKQKEENSAEVTPEQEVPVDTTWMKDEYVPVTSFIHTLDFKNYRRVFQSHTTPDGFYKNNYYKDLDVDEKHQGGNIFDETEHFCLRNTFGVAMLEGFNKWIPMGLKLFGAHELRRYALPDENVFLKSEYEHHMIIGGQLQKTLGSMFHYKVKAESYVMGNMTGDISLEGEGDMNFPLFGDTVSLKANAFFKHDKPTYYFTKYRSKHLQWDLSDDRQTHIHLEGLLDIGKTNTQLRVAYDNIGNRAYFAYMYDINPSTNLRSNADVQVLRSPNMSILTAQLIQKYSWKAINFETQLTYQQSSHPDIIPVPTFNAYANLYLKFRIARVLATELGADIRYFTSYAAPDYSPTLGVFCAQGNGENNVKVGDYPIINVYANFHLKHARFFAMMSHVNSSAGDYFLTPHYAQNASTVRFGVSWNFFN